MSENRRGGVGGYSPFAELIAKHDIPRGDPFPPCAPTRIETWRGNDATITRYAPGLEPTAFTPGDLGLVTAWDASLLQRLIRAGARAKYGDTDVARWTHAFLITSADGDIVEALADGIDRTHISKYRDADYITISPTKVTKTQRRLAVAFAQVQVGDRYDYVDFIGLALQAMFNVKLSLHVSNAFICSGLAARATEKYIVGYPKTPESCMPADLAAFWGAHTDQELPKFKLADRLLNILVAVSTLFRG